MSPHLIVLWAFNAVLLVACIATTARTIFSKRDQARRIVNTALDEHLPTEAALEHLNDLLHEAWTAVLLQYPDSGSLRGVNGIGLLARSRDAERAALLLVAEDAVKELNNFARLIDFGLIRSTQIQRWHPRRHILILRLTYMLEPVIWYHAIRNVRGRWAFRVLELRNIFAKLQRSSSEQSLRKGLSINFRGHSEIVVGPTNYWASLWWRFWFSFIPPRISTRSKVAQKRQGRELEAFLVEEGVLDSVADRRARSQW